MAHDDGLRVFFKGMAMGAADAVPGVSGGTVAFITGIYEQLIGAIHRINPSLIGLWQQQGLRAVWQYIDGRFLLTLLGGILSSLLLLAHLISYLLLQHPILLFSFFFGLVLASVFSLYQQLDQPGWRHHSAIILGVLAMMMVDLLVPNLDVSSPIDLLIAGSVAICAMILPGISGSFLLLIMGVYGGVMDAVKTLDLTVLSWFILGCILGLVCFSQLLNWLFRHFRDMTIAVLTGVLVGSLSKIWPWQQVTAYKLDSSGRSIPLTHDNLLPSSYSQISGSDAQWVYAVILMLTGFALVWLFHRHNR